MCSARSVCALLVPLALEGCHTAVLSPAGPIGAADRAILLDALAIMLAIVVPTILATLAFAWWFRASNTRARYLPTWSYSGRMELIVWSIPALVVFFLGGIAWIGSHLLDPARPLSSGAKPLEIQVVSLDWKWLFIYPEQGVASVNNLVAPAGAPLHFRNHLSERVQRVLRTAARQRDLLDVRHDHPALPASRSSGHLSWPLRSFQR